MDESRASAAELDRVDDAAMQRGLFELPASPGDLSKPAVYLTGNSLGLMPKGVQEAVEQELEAWARLGVAAHEAGAHPWLAYNEEFREMGARLVGAVPGEVVMMNSLTVNLHLMMVSFYRPEGGRRKILIEDAAFPSDSYAVQSQLRFHGIDPAEGQIRVKAREGEHSLRTEDVIEAIARNADELALVLLPGVNYLTGQFFDMEAITRAGREAGAVVGWDLAHAAGNVSMRMHDWNVDFACWCSYKYLNAGPGAVAGCFVHERHGRDTDLVRFAGWWGNEPSARFEMRPEFVARAGADGWQLSNPPILSMAPLRVSLEIFDRVGMEAIRRRSERLTGYLLEQIEAIGSEAFEVITPREVGARGAQLSLATKRKARELHGALLDAGVFADFREPNVIRVAPAPLYNTFEECWRVVDVLRRHSG
jgi:kynureninase